MKKKTSCFTINCRCCGEENESEFTELSQIDDSVSGGISRFTNTVIMIGVSMKEVVSGGIIMTLPEKYRPSKDISLYKLTGIEADPGKIPISIQTDGKVINGSSVTRNYFDLNFMYQIG